MKKNCPLVQYDVSSAIKTINIQQQNTQNAWFQSVIQKNSRLASMKCQSSIVNSLTKTTVEIPRVIV